MMIPGHAVKNRPPGCLEQQSVSPHVAVGSTLPMNVIRTLFAVKM